MNIPSLSPRWRAAATTCLVRASIVGFALIGCASPALAQLSRVGNNPNLGAAPVRGTDTAYDPVNNVYLVVGSAAANNINPLFGVFTDTAGNPITAPFAVNNGGQHAHFARVVYSPHVSNGAGGSGGFLVTWHGGLFTNSVRTRVVAYPNRVVSPEFEIPSLTFQEAGPSVAYSPVSQVFLVTWQASDYAVRASRVALNGQPVGAPFNVSQPGVGARDPSAAWNAETNEFGVVYSGFAEQGATTTFARVSTSGDVLRRNTFNVVGGGTYITDLAYNTITGRYVAAWAQGGTHGAEINGNGDVLAKGLLSSGTGSYDGLGLAYNPVSGTFLLVGQGNSYNVWAAELNRSGARISADTEVTSTGAPGAFHPRAGANTEAPEWNISYYHSGLMRDQVVRTSSTSGGPGGSLGAVAPPPPPPPGGGSGSGCNGSAPFPGAVCVNGGWVPGSSGGGTPGGCTTSSPGSGWTCVNGGWSPPTGGGGSTGGCTTPDPFSAIGGGTCVNGGWRPGGGGSGSTGGCATSAPGAGWTCVNGGWLPPGSGGTGGSGGGCPGSAPFPGAACLNGGWVPGNTPGAGGGNTGGCPGSAPFPGAACLNGGWVPGNTPGAGGGNTGGCPGSAPFPGAACLNGGWVPGNTPGAGGGGNTGGCPGSAPFPGAACLNGGWVPGGTPGAGGGNSGGCPGTAPFPGAVCVNGGWIPGSSNNTCTTADPFASLGGGTCLNGGWTFGPPASNASGGCALPDPFTAMGGGACINGGWIPKSR